MKRVFLFFLSLALGLGMILSGGTEVSAKPKENAGSVDELGLYSQSAVLLDALTGRILYGKNEDMIRPMASTTKIMTCIVALENGTLSDCVIATANAAAQPKVRLGVFKGQTFRLEDLLYSLMLESHNDAAVMIAEHIGGSVEGFASLMNQKARDLGCLDTYFITPNGLDASLEENGEKKEHTTTAADLARIMDYCIETSPQREAFLKITATQSYFFSDLEKKRSYHCTNHNALLSMMDGAFSGKTGFTGGAGYSYVGALKAGDRTFTIALLGCGWPPHKTYKWSDARKLFDYGKSHFQYRDVFREMEFPAVPVDEGIPSSGDLKDPVTVPLSLYLEAGDKNLKLLMSEDEEVEVSKELPDRLKAPLREGQAVGTVTYRLHGETVRSYPVYAKKSVERLSFSWCLNRVIMLYCKAFAPSV